MNLYAGVGQRTLAISQYEVLRAILAESLGARPSADTYALYRKIHSDAPLEQPLIVSRNANRDAGQLATQNLTHDSVPDADAQSPAGNVSLRAGRSFAGHNAVFLSADSDDLPQPTTELIGRQAELGRVASQFADPTCRLVTLVGPGGMGKSRIAIAAGRNLNAPITFVPLAGVLPATGEMAIDSLITQITQVLGLRFLAPQPPRGLLLNHLANERRVLLLDSFEHLLDAAPFLNELIEQAPDIRLFVTSRVRLGLAAEWVVDVTGMGSGGPPAGELAGGVADKVDDADRLFESVARRTAPAFDLHTNLPAVKRIVSLVQGSPLGIELAANWVRALPCQEIAQRLATDLDLLTNAVGVDNGRHSSMRAVLDSSWSLLDSDARPAFAALSTFSGWFDASAAQQVAGCKLLTLAGLVDRSWIKAVDAAGQTRYFVHDLLRQYGLEKLSEHEYLESLIRERHASHFSTKLIAASDALKSFDDCAFESVALDVANIRSAWQWLADHRSAHEVAGFVEALNRYFVYKGWLGEATRMLERALQMDGASQPLSISWHRMLAQDFWQSGRIRRAMKTVEEILRLAGERVPRSKSALWQVLPVSIFNHVQVLLGVVRSEPPTSCAQDQAYALQMASTLGYFISDRPAKLLHHILRANHLSVSNGLTTGTMGSYAFLAVLWRALGSQRLANFYNARAFALLPAVRDDSLTALAAQTLGVDLYISGRMDRAIQVLERGAACFRSSGEWRLMMDASAISGMVEVARGRRDAAHSCWQAVREGGRQYGDRLCELWGLIGAAETDLRARQAPDVRLLDRAEQLLAAGTPHEHGRYEAARAGAALISGNMDLADRFASRATTTFSGIKLLAFGDGEGCVNAAHVMLSLAALDPTRVAWRDGADRASALAMRFARANPYLLARACSQRARFERLLGRNASARRLLKRAHAAAIALDMTADAQEAAQALRRLATTTSTSAAKPTY